MAHHSHSLSGSKRRYKCPGSVALEAPFPDTGNKSSNAGTAMHELAAWCLTEHRRAELRIGESIKLREGEYVEITDDMAELVQGYVDTVRVLGIDNRMLIEQQVDVSPFTGIAGQFGTADCIIVTGDELMVIDLKTGYRPVSPVDNTQLQLYALGALNLLYGQEAQGLAPAVRQDADNHRQPDAGVVADHEDPAGADTQAAEEGREDDLW